MATLTRPNVIARAATLAAVSVTVAAVILLVHGGSSYSLRLEMTNANGLRPGSQVLLGGVGVGTVESIDLGGHDAVIANLGVDPNRVHIGQGVSASIIAANLLGEEYVALNPGNPNVPLPSGTLLPPPKIMVPTDLDQIVNVFDAGTRQRLAILIDELGIAVAGRGSDVSAILRQLPLSAEAATRLLTQIVQDNHALRTLVANSNQFITRINDQKTDLLGVIDAASGAATTAASQASNLRQTLVDAPQALNTFRRFIVALGHTADGLTRPATELQTVAGPLDTLLGQIRPFAQTAVPALNRAASVAPLLTRLGVEGTPVVRQAVPTVTALSRIASLAGPLTYWLSASIVDALGSVQGWDRAIQFRDGVGHVYHAEVGIEPSLIVNFGKSGTAPAAKRDRRALSKSPSGKPAAAAAPSKPAPGSTSSAPAPAPRPTVGSAVSGVPGAVAGATPTLSKLLKYLISP
jgi:virulence factor Mce-like protein